MNLFSKASSIKRPRLDEEKEGRQAPGTIEDLSLQGEPSLHFSSLGLCDWVCKSASSMGFRHPTDIQQACIPAILKGCDVMGCAETGAGKTAAFALPILDHLSKDPYGIFAIVLTPTRELAIQIHQQFAAIGVPIGLKQALIIGGENMTEQSLSLSRYPHVVIATPGRLRHHIEGPDPPSIRRAQYLVLDEADRLLAAGFSSELGIIMSNMPPTRRTLLFSATLTSSLSELDALSMKNILRFDLTVKRKLPAKLSQQYIFIPAQVKLCYLVAVIRKAITSSQPLIDEEQESKSSRAANELIAEATSEQRKKYKKRRKQDRVSAREEHQEPSLSGSGTMSIIIFVSSCRRCEEIAALLNTLGHECSALHSMKKQAQRTAALSDFKSCRTRILVATDVASRGLDIPEVALVINVDLPKVVSDYVHRVGRTGRAGREGRALTLVTQHDVDLVHAVESFTETKMALSEEVKEDEIVPLLNVVAKAMRVAQAKLLENGFDEKLKEFTKRKKIQRAKLGPAADGRK